MDVTRRCDYACRILRAAYQSKDGHISVAAIAEQENIPYAFARSIQHDLVKGGLVRTVRGAHGGLSLAMDPAKMTMLNILESVQGPLTVSTCVLDPEYCKKSINCAFNKVWQGADKILRDYLSSITLKDLFEQGIEHPSIVAAMNGNSDCVHNNTYATLCKPGAKASQ